MSWSASLVGSLILRSRPHLYEDVWLAFDAVHMMDPHDVGMLFQGHPGRDRPFERLAKPLGVGLVGLLEGFEGLRSDGFQVKAQVDFPHATHQNLMDLEAAAHFVAGLVAGLRFH